jgi:hypothetical protein
MNKLEAADSVLTAHNRKESAKKKKSNLINTIMRKTSTIFRAYGSKENVWYQEYEFKTKTVTVRLTDGATTHLQLRGLVNGYDGKRRLKPDDIFNVRCDVYKTDKSPEPDSILFELGGPIDMFDTSGGTEPEKLPLQKLQEVSAVLDIIEEALQVPAVTVTL